MTFSPVDINLLFWHLIYVLHITNSIYVTSLNLQKFVLSNLGVRSHNALPYFRYIPLVKWLDFALNTLLGGNRSFHVKFLRDLVMCKFSLLIRFSRGSPDLNLLSWLMMKIYLQPSYVKFSRSWELIIIAK